MKITLFAALAMFMPAFAQTPEDLITQYGLQVRRVQTQTGAAAQKIYFRTGGAPVKNAPYSADAVTETTQSLTDGNRIMQRTTQKLFRDTDGRERREESVLAVGALAQTEMPRTITISDPIENVSYTLDPQQRIAIRSTGLGARVNWVAGDVFGALGGVTLQAPLAGRGGRGTVQATAGTQSLKEDLGSKNVEGVIAQGTRFTETIPAGQIGNQLPIKVVDEVWHSNELQMDVLTTHTDPRSGEVTYKLTNISRANPPHNLFEAPADYTLTGNLGGAGGRGGPAGTEPGAGGRGRGGARGTQK